MKKILPYLMSLLVGSLFGFILFNNKEIKINSVFKENINATGFQLGVFNSIDMAKEFNSKYPTSIIILDDDVYRVYYSILTKEKTISKMEDYLNKNKIAFYKKEITITDKGLIKALNTYENVILEGNDITLESINKLIMESYGGNI